MLVQSTPGPSPVHAAVLDTAAVPLIHVVDDEETIQSLFAGLAKVGGFEIARYTSAQAFLDAFDDRRIGCLVLDLMLPDRTGIELLQELSSRGFALPVVFMSGMASVSEAVQAFKLGSIDFVEKPFDLQVMLETLRRAIQLDRERRRTGATGDDLRSRFARLSSRETEVLELIVQGAANKEVAVRLGLSPKTIEVHRANVMRKTQASSFAELVRMHVALRG